jgi:hypothetical protein
MTKACRFACDGIGAMPSARALLVASLLTEPPFGCLGPSGNDRYRKRSEALGASRAPSCLGGWAAEISGRETTTAGRLFKSGSEKPVHGDSPLVAESGAWCNDLGCRWHKGELR